MGSDREAMEGQAGKNSGAPSTPRRWAAVLLAAVVIGGAYALVALIGRAQEEREERVLGVLTPLFEWVRGGGGTTQAWLQDHLALTGIVASAALAIMAAVGLWQRRTRAAPVALLALGVGLAGWGQVAIQADRAALGFWLYVSGVGAALALGIWCPLTALPSLPPFPPPPTGARPAGPRRWYGECALVVILSLLALISRSYALTELYDFLDLETIDWMVQGRTWHGYLGYLDFGFVQNNGGAVQFLPTQIVFRLFGTSIFTLRLTSVLWSVVAVPLMYWLGRRLGGMTAGVVSSVLLITAPEQLFWARNENLHFAPIAVCALVTAHLALWMVERFSVMSVLCNALWMPWCRWFYSASMVSFLIPLATFAHAAVFVRGLWRRIWYVLPLLALGLAGWIFSLTVMKAALHDWQWNFVDPAAVYGASAWRKQGEFRDASWADLIRLQAVSVSRNFTLVAVNFTDHVDNFDHWCMRAQPPAHRTIINIGLMLTVWVTLGYLLGQCYDRRAFLLLAWWGISLLPGILSLDPAPRRMAMVFPASHALGGVGFAAMIALARERGGRLAASFARAAAAIALAVIALTNLSSHFALPTQPALYSDYPRFAKPLFETSDTIFTNFPPAFRMLAVFGNLDRFLASPPCLQSVEPGDWMRAALSSECTFDDTAFRITMRADEIERWRAQYHPRRISYLLFDDPVTHPQVDLLHALFPNAEVRDLHSRRSERHLVSLTVDAADVAALHTPSVWGDPATDGALASVIEDVPLRREAGRPEGAGPGTIVVEGGILIDQEGWYGWQLAPPCPNATLVVDGQTTAPDRLHPLMAGAHPFALTIPSGGTCRLPVRLLQRSDRSDTATPLPANRILSRSVSALAAARASGVVPYDGYAQPEPFISTKGQPVDFGVDADGNVTVLVLEHGVWRLRRFDGTGAEQAAWTIDVPRSLSITAIAVGADGVTAVLIQNTVRLYDRHGRQVAAWQHPWFTWESELAMWGPDLIVANIHHRDSIAAFTRTGDLVREIKTFAGGPQKFYQPFALALTPAGDMLVQQLDGQALWFRVDDSAFTPIFSAAVRANSTLFGSGFDRRDRVLVPHAGGVRVFDAAGQRLMASDPARDLSKRTMGAPLRIEGTGDHLYVLDSGRNTIWRLTR